MKCIQSALCDSEVTSGYGKFAEQTLVIGRLVPSPSQISVIGHLLYSCYGLLASTLIFIRHTQVSLNTTEFYIDRKIYLTSCGFYVLVLYTDTTREKRARGRDNVVEMCVNVCNINCLTAKRVTM